MDPLYDYVSEIANRMYPTWEFDDVVGSIFKPILSADGILCISWRTGG